MLTEVEKDTDWKKKISLIDTGLFLKDREVINHQNESKLVCWYYFASE